MAGRSERLAFVIPWYGPDIVGGAELVCRKTAEHLADAGVDVEILTTCARDLFSGWSENAHPEGATVINGVPVRRFGLTREPLVKFGDLNARLIAGERLSTEDEIRYLRESVNSERLYRFLDSERDRYQYLFLPYLFGTTYWGAQVAPERSWLIPCLHDEGYARMGVMTDLFRQVQGHIFHSASEREFARDLYGLDPSRLFLWGGGVDTEGIGDADRFRGEFGIDSPFLLYVGRRDPGKNTPLLIEYFCRYQTAHPSPLKLVLAGKGEVRIPSRYQDQIIDIGPISEQNKLDAMKAAFAFCNPSVNESFSLVIMESWVQGTPVLANALCGATAGHCLASSGGLPFRGFAEFAGCLDWYLEHEDLRKKMGELGQRYVFSNFRWDQIVDRYASLVRQ